MSRLKLHNTETEDAEKQLKDCGADSLFEPYGCLEDIRKLDGDVDEGACGCYILPYRMVNIKLNGKDRKVLLVTEEKSVVAGLNYASKIFGDVKAYVDKSYPVCVGQIYVRNMDHNVSRIEEDLKYSIIDNLNEARTHSNVEDIHVSQDNNTIEVYMNPGDGMGAGLASKVTEQLSHFLSQQFGYDCMGNVVSNAFGRMVVAEVSAPFDALERNGFSGKEVAERVVELYEWSRQDPTRYVTHVKGILNGVEGVAKAYYQDTRALHGLDYPAKQEWHEPVEWSIEGDRLYGKAMLTLPVGTVRGEIDNYLGKGRKALEFSGIKNADELATIIGAAGLLQNYAALSMLAASSVNKEHNKFR